MTPTLKLFVHWWSKTLVKSLDNPAGFTLPALFQGDVLPLEIHLLESPSSGVTPSYALPAIDNLALTALLLTPDWTTLAQQTSWTKDTTARTFTGQLALNDPALDTYVGSAVERAVIFGLVVQDESGSTSTILETTARLRHQILPSVELVTAPGETPLSLERALQLFVPYELPTGRGITLKHSSGSRVVLRAGADGELEGHS